MRVAHCSRPSHSGREARNGDAPGGPGLLLPEWRPEAWSPSGWSSAHGLGQDWDPSHSGDLITYPAANVAVTSSFFHCNLSLQLLSVPWMVGSRETGTVFAQCTVPRGPEQCRGTWARSTALLAGWVGGWSQPSHDLHGTSATSHGLLLQLFKEKSLVLPHHLTAVPPKADSHPSCDMCQALPSFPTTEPSPATRCTSLPLLCEFQRGCRWVWAVTLIPSPGFSEHWGRGWCSQREVRPALPSGNRRPRSPRRQGALTALSGVHRHLPHSRGQVGASVSGGGQPSRASVWTLRTLLSVTFPDRVCCSQPVTLLSS